MLPGKIYFLHLTQAAEENGARSNRSAPRVRNRMHQSRFQGVSGAVPLSLGGGQVSLSLWEFEATVGYTYKFGAPAPAVVAKY